MKQRHLESLRLAAYYVLAILFVVWFMSLFMGCAHRPLTPIKGAFTNDEAEGLGEYLKNRFGWRYRWVQGSGSNGTMFTPHSLAFSRKDWENVEIGTMIIAERPDGSTVIHPVHSGSHEKGFRLKGIANFAPDFFHVTEKNYVGTYIGQLFSNGK